MPGSKLKYPYSILWGFTVHSPLRRNCIRLVEWEWFDRTSLILIVLNVITMMLSEPTRTEIVSIDYLFAWTDPMFSILFTFELVAKVLASGFILTPNTYLRDGWN